MILFDRVNFRYSEKSETSFKLKEVSFSCQKGLIHGIIGGNGSGKSTIARLIAGLLEPVTGKVTVDEVSPFNHIGKCGFLAGIIFQNPENQIVGTTVAEDLAFGLENLSIPYEEMQCRVITAADRFHLADLLKMPITSLSGGQKQLLCIASVMIMEPSWVIFDEPTSHLDPWARRDFWTVIKSFASEKNIGVMVVSQLPEDLNQFSRILAFDRGELVFDGDQEQLQLVADAQPWFNLPESWKLQRLLRPKNG